MVAVSRFEWRDAVARARAGMCCRTQARGAFCRLKLYAFTSFPLATGNGLLRFIAFDCSLVTQ